MLIMSIMTPQLKREYDRLLPHLKVLNERELAHAKSMQERNLGLGVSQAFEFGQQFNKEYVFISFLPGYVQELIVGLLDAPSWRSFRPMYSSWVLDWTCHSAGRQLYKGHEHHTPSLYFFSHCFIEHSRSVFHTPYTTHFTKDYVKYHQQASCPDTCQNFTRRAMWG